VQIFRPHIEALPAVEKGDAILLRNFSVLSIKGKGFGLRSTEEGSSWAVFKSEGDEVQVKGPPVEFGDGEREHVKLLKAWWAALDASVMKKLDKVSGNKMGKVG